MKARITALFSGMALACAAHAMSITDYVHPELGLGVNRYQTYGDGIWYQEAMEHHLDLIAPVFSIGATGPISQRGSWGIDWHVDYVNLGHVSSQCECTPADQNYDAVHHRLITPLPDNVGNANFVGNGNAQGIALTLEPHLNYQHWRLGVEGGLFPYRPSWNETIYDWAPGPGIPAATITANTPHGIQLGWVVGFNVGRGPLSVSLQHYFLPNRFDSNHFPTIYTGADVLLLKYRF